MKYKTIILLAVATLISGKLIGNNTPLNNGLVADKSSEVSMDMEINGTIQLYSVLKEEIELIDTEVIQGVSNKNTKNWHLAYNRDYFIGYSDSQVESITPSNFKRIAKKYFSTIPALAASIGKKGFRYKNLPTIILYYNKLTVEGKAITKEDKLTVKQIR